ASYATTPPDDRQEAPPVPPGTITSCRRPIRSTGSSANSGAAARSVTCHYGHSGILGAATAPMLESRRGVARFLREPRAEPEPDRLARRPRARADRPECHLGTRHRGCLAG